MLIILAARISIVSLVGFSMLHYNLASTMLLAVERVAHFVLKET
jgi:hypothetical protein